MIKKEPLTDCSACGSSDLVQLRRMDAFPHIGIYLKNPADSVRYPKIDNSLHFCPECGHIQLGYTVDPAFLYTTEFQHKTSQSASAKQANDFLYGFATRVFANRAHPSVVVEIGCNDTFLLQKFVDIGAVAVGVDPILTGREAIFLEGVAAEHKSRFKVVGKFVEQVDFKSEVGQIPDLFISNFVFEHIRDPFAVTQGLINKMGADSVAIIGVPGAEFMVYNSRYDQLSHQHYQQFNLQSFKRMIARAGGEVIDHAVNFTNWGQIIVAFRKARSKQDVSQYRTPYSLAQVEESSRLFDAQIDLFKRGLTLIGHKPMIGFGAAQNFPVFDYFCGSNLPFTQILDDHPLRQNHSYPHLPYRITVPENNYEGFVGVLTGPDYSRVLVPRMAQLKFDHIVIPFSAN